MNKTDILSLGESRLRDFFAARGAGAYRGEQLFLSLHKKRLFALEKTAELPRALRSELTREFFVPPHAIKHKLEAADGTVKYVYAVDGGLVETVIIKSQGAHAACVSAQLGCSFACAFCASGANGFTRNLSAGEMLLQIYAAERDLNITVSRVLLMGTGEPLDNFDAALRFISLLREKNAKNLSVRNITLSTCGLPGGIKRLADNNLKINLSVSLHAANDETRKRLMPKAAAHSITDVIKAADYFFDKTGRRVTFEYILIAGVNDRDGDADGLSRLLSGKNVHINLIKYNDAQKKGLKPGNAAFFENALRRKGLNATVRNSKGGAIAAACGQLAAGARDRG